MPIVNNDTKEDFVTSLILNTQNTNQDPLSAEDVAWIDSCLVNDLDILDRDWTSMKDVLLNILVSQPDSANTTGAGAYSEDIVVSDIEILPSNVEEEATKSQFITDDDLVSIHEETENSNDDTPNESINVSSQDLYKNAFLPGSIDGILENKSNDSDLDLGFSENDLEVPIEDIFKVWDLNIPTEEDELVQQLKKATEGSYYEWKFKPSTFEESTLDDLIAGILDLSLRE